MESNIQRFQLIELVRPYETFEQDDSRYFFSEVMRVRKSGYSSRHRSHVLPVDTTDFLSTHFIIAAQIGPDLVSLGGYRAIDLQTCETYQTPFPLTSILQQAQAMDQLEQVQSIIDSSRNRSKIVYQSAWTFCPDAKKNSQICALLKDLMTTMTVLSQTGPDEIRFACGIPRLKTDEYISFLGYEKLRSKSGEIEPILQKNLQNEKVELMILRSHHSLEAQEIARKHHDHWRNRIRISHSAAQNLSMIRPAA